MCGGGGDEVLHSLLLLMDAAAQLGNTGSKESARMQCRKSLQCLTPLSPAARLIGPRYHGHSG